jgi:hypothetical protein
MTMRVDSRDDGALGKSAESARFVTGLGADPLGMKEGKGGGPPPLQMQMGGLP